MTDTTLRPDERIESAELFGEYGPYAVEIDPRPKAVLVWTEDLRWHVTVRGLTCLMTDEDTINPLAAGALEAELRRLLGEDLDNNANVYVQISDQDEPALEVSVDLDVVPFTRERLGDVAWPHVATLTNVFDPGTFGAEYVMGNVARVLESASDTCIHCDRTILFDEAGSTWIDPEASGDDSIWRATCDRHETFVAEHEPKR